MTRAYSNFYSRACRRAHLAGAPIRSVAARFGVGVSCVPRWTARYRRTGGVAPGKAVRHAIRSADTHLRFLPARSPDLNPIEPAIGPANDEQPVVPGSGSVSKRLSPGAPGFRRRPP